MISSQYEDVLEYMKTHGSITSYEAFERLGTTRLSAVIHTLKKKGHRISVEYHAFVNQYGHSGRYAEYSLLGEDE